MDSTRRNILLLAVAQGFLLTNGVTLVAVNGLVGVSLAPTLWLATFPVTAYVIGAALTTLPAAFFMKRHGRRAGFMLGSGLGIAGALISAFAVSIGNFWLLCARHAVRRRLQRLRPAIPFCRRRRCRTDLEEPRHLADPGRRHPRRRHRARAVQAHARPAGTDLHGQLSGAGGLRLPLAAHRQPPRHPAAVQCRAARQGTAAARDRGTAEIPRRGARRRLRLRRDEPADDGDAHRHGPVPLPVRRRRLRARMARHRHVRAVLLHRQPDQALRHAAHPVHRRPAQLPLHRHRAHPASR